MSALDYRQARQQMGRRRWRRFFFRTHVVIFSIGLFLFFFWLRALPIGYPIFLIPPTIWGLLLIGHWFYKGTADAQDAAMERLWENLYSAQGDTKLPATPEPELGSRDLGQLRQLVEVELMREKVKRRRSLFRMNVAAYLVVMLLGWIIIPVFYGPFLTESAALTIFALSIGGLVEVVLHYLATRLDNTEGERALRERLLGRAIQQLTENDDRATEKVKRTMRLSDDGELLDLIDEQLPPRQSLNQE